MCNALCECLKCPGKVVCCCCNCACKLLMTILCSGILLLVVIGLIVYFTVFYHKNSGSDSTNVTEANAKALIAAVTPSSFKDYFTKLD